MIVEEIGDWHNEKVLLAVDLVDHQDAANQLLNILAIMERKSFFTLCR